MLKNAPVTRRQSGPYPKLWGWSVTSICYRLGIEGWDSATAQIALEKLLGCELNISTIRTGISDGDNAKYEKGRAAQLTQLQFDELSQAAGKTTSGRNEGVELKIAPILYPDELPESTPVWEGARKVVTVNAYERDPVARRRCIEAHGCDCSVCGCNFEKKYGSIAKGYIHIHHLKPLSEVGEQHKVDPVVDLRPVCPNCHAVLHRRVPALSIDEVRELLGSVT